MQTPFANSVFRTTLADNAESITELVWLVEEGPAEFKPFILSSYSGGGRLARLSESSPEKPRNDARMLRLLLEAESDVSHRLVDRSVHFERLGLSNMWFEGRAADMNHSLVISALYISIPLEDGRYLEVWLAPSLSFRKGLMPLFILGAIVITTGLSLSLVLSLVFLRPIRRLETEAESIDFALAGQGITVEGPIELRRISGAFNKMHSRLVALLTERQRMLSAVAHDIRTGITRLRLRLDDKDTISSSELDKDMVQIETLVSDMLAYARAEDPRGPRELIKLRSFLRDLVIGSPYKLELSAADFVDTYEQIIGDPVSLRRLFDNLVENAHRYGDGLIEVTCTRDDDGTWISINDNGPGVPEEKLEQIFEPFQRLEGSRSRLTGGTGLGLGIAKAIANAHGASLTLENRNPKGLSAKVFFPKTVMT